MLDVACGNGDLLRRIRRWADRRGLAATLEGIDLDPRSAEAAATSPEMRIAYRAGDVFADAAGAAAGRDRQLAVHASSERSADSSCSCTGSTGTRARLVHRRSAPPRVAYYAFPLLARAARLHRFVRHDGVVSIARSFRRADWERALAAAGLTRRDRWHVPFRLCVGRLK